MKKEHLDDFGAYIRGVKICDPAIGSGAFPMGLLNELARCRVSINAWAKDDKGNLLEGDYAALKTEIISNNIYGVDIEKGAIDIARLRFWLSIIVDEQTPHVLPNLDYKFMQGNSLIPTFDGKFINLDTTSQSHVNVVAMKKEKQHLYELKQKYYKAEGEDKHELNVQIKDTILKLVSRQLGYESRAWYLHNAVQTTLDFGEVSAMSFGKVRQSLPADKLESIELAETLHAKLNDKSIPVAERSQIDIHFFDWRIMFTEVFDNGSDGFDIVVGNPPYGAKMSSEIKRVLKKIYTSAVTIPNLQKGSLDTFSLFIDLGYILLHCNGNAIFIVPLSITASDSMSGIHRLLIEKCDNIYISSYGDRPRRIFESAEQQVSIVSFVKTNQRANKIMTTHINKRYSDESLWILLDDLKYVNSIQHIRNGRIPKIGDEIEKNILDKLKKCPTTLQDLYSDSGSSVFYRKAGGRYYKIITKVATKSSAEGELTIKYKYQDLVGAALSSNLFYWFWLIHSDWHNLRSSELGMFPIPYEKFSDKDLDYIGKLYDSYLDDLYKNSKTTKTGLKCFFARQSKAYIDSIDKYIGKKYGLSIEEINYLINYDIQFRNDE